MKKKLLLSLLIASLMLASGVGVYAATKLTLVVNGEQASVDPLLQNGTTYVPVRAAAEMLGADVTWNASTKTASITSKEIVTLIFPADKYPATAAHISAAIANGKSAVCTIDRTGADVNRDQSLAGVPLKDGFDRDEFPMAMCAEGGKGASVAYVEPSDNRGAGSWIGNQLEDYAEGTKVVIAVLGVDTSKVQLFAKVPDTTSSNNVVYNSCADVKAAGAAPIRKGDPGYSTKLDRDGDGIACET